MSFGRKKECDRVVVIVFVNTKWVIQVLIAGK